MCGIHEERERIDRILEHALPPAGSLARYDEAALIETGLVALREAYSSICSEDCMRARCEAFVARLARQRWTLEGAELDVLSV